MPDKLVLNGEPSKPGPFQYKMLEAMERNSPADLALLSSAHALRMGPCAYARIQTFCDVIRDNELMAFADTVRAVVPRLDEDQSKCDKISVGAVIGVMDGIRRRKDGSFEIIDIKCCQTDDIEYWYNQTYVYACLYHLRYGHPVSGARIWNFLNGKEFEFTFRIDTASAKRVIRALCDLPEHQMHLQ